MTTRLGNADVLPPYEDHVRLWADELRAWVPDAVFDSHVHIGPPEAVGPIAPERRADALTTFMSLSWEELLDTHAALYSGKTIRGLVAVPFPQREVNGERANDYIIEAMKRAPRVQGFLVSEPTATRSAVAAFERALRAGVRFSGVKPYADRLGKSNFEATMAEFLPEDLLAFMERERLVMLLHTSGLGVVTEDVQNFLRRMADRYPHVRVLLAHMGRYVSDQQFLAFMDTDILATCPTLYLEMSSASCPEVYDRVLQCEWLHSRLLFGSDLPFGAITGVEHWSDTHGAIFLTRDTYAWSDHAMNAEFALQRQRLTYNTYHCIQAFREALTRQGYGTAQAERIKRDVFCGNALRLFGCDPAGNTNCRT